LPAGTGPGGPPGLYEQVLASLGGQPPAPPRPARASSAVVPWRRRGDTLEVFWLQRAPSLAFMGGWYGFPGGTLGSEDAAVPLAGTPAGLENPQASTPQPESIAGEDLGPDLLPGIAACALRELAEETGLELSDASRLVFAGRWLTPPVGPLRFDNRFFLLPWPEAEPRQPRMVPGESVEGGWIAPAAALAAWRRGDLLAAPPVLHILRVLAEDGPELGLPRLRDTAEASLGSFRTIEFRPGVLLFPLRTPTLPPAATTNAYLLGHGDAVLVDPGSPFPEENQRLLAALEEAERRLGRRTTAIWLTHHHPDHIGGVETVRRALGVPVLAHPATAERLAALGIEVDGELVDGQVVTLAGEPPISLRVVHSPGHTRGHLVFFYQSDRTLIAGDLVSSLSTIVIDPPEGNMDAFLATLARVRDLGPRTLLPAHGPAIRDGVAKLEETLAHRLGREEKVLAAWNSGLREPREMVGTVYQDTPQAARPLAERQIVAHLERLRRWGRI
jgi:glyoxylase-like metal-dependent hydrolase (beta-lactamase superfamily II)/8-oxo-dGTP pyrophosphatase MutT (NUDIX family)